MVGNERNRSPQRAMADYREYILRTTGDGPPPLPVGDAMVLIAIPEGHTVVVLSLEDQLTLRGMLNSESVTETMTQDELSLQRRLANGGTDG